MIDLRSDTVTLPSAGMREAMARAPVGDDQYGEDPTINALQERVAHLLGRNRAIHAKRHHGQPGRPESAYRARG